MIKASKIKKAIAKGISQNPTTITLQITEKMIVKGCFVEVKSTHDITCIIYWQENQQATKIYIDKQGSTEENQKWSMICDGSFDMTVNQNRKIEFIHPISGNKFHINHSYPFVIENQLCGYECGLKEVS